jgi:sugar phosphate isomerase/epimerase
MLSARDVVGHPEGFDAAAEAVRSSGLRVTGFQVLRDFEGLSGHLHEYKIDIAKSMLEMCYALGSKVLLVCSSTSTHATDDPDALARDLRKLAMLAIPLGVNVAYEGLSWGRSVNEFTAAWDIVCRANAPNLGIGLDSYHMFATTLTCCCRRRYSWCSSPTSCGRKSGRRRNGSQPPATSESSLARVYIAPR